MDAYREAYLRLQKRTDDLLQLLRIAHRKTLEGFDAEKQVTYAIMKLEDALVEADNLLLDAPVEEEEK